MRHKSKARQAGIAIDAYMRFRATQEGMAYEFTPEFFEKGILRGLVAFFGVTFADGKLTGDLQQPALFEQWQQQNQNMELENMTQDKRDAAFKSLADEVFRLSHTIRLADNEEEPDFDECYELGHLSRLIPLLCAHNVMALNRLTMVLLDLQDKQAIEVEPPTH